MNPYLVGIKCALRAYPRFRLPVGIRLALHDYPFMPLLRKWNRRRWKNRLEQACYQLMVIMEGNSPLIHIALDRNWKTEYTLFKTSNKYREALCGAMGKAQHLSIYWIKCFDFCPDCWPEEGYQKMLSLKAQLEREEQCLTRN